MKEEFHSFILENIKFYNFLPDNVVINDYVDKLLKLSTIITVYKNGKLAGFISYYDNDIYKRSAFISLILVDNHLLSKSLGRTLLTSCISDLKSNEFKSLELKVKKDNHRAIKFYSKMKFIVSKEDDYFFTMVLDLVKITRSAL